MNSVLKSAGRWCRLALLPICLIVALPAWANTATCPSNSAEVRISETITPAHVDDTKDEAQLAAMRFDEPVASDRRFLQLTGLTVAGITVDQEIRFASQGPEGGPYCVWPSVVTVTLSTAPVIYLVASHGQCLMTVGLEHEKRHVAVNQDLIGRYGPVFRERVRSMMVAISQDQRAPTTDPQLLRTRIEEKVNAIIAVTSDRMYADWKADQQAIDTMEEYRRISNTCPQVTVDPSIGPSLRTRSGA